MNTVTETLDARGLNCPLPILKTRKALDNLDSGQIMQVIATDPGTVKDIGAFCEQTGHALRATEVHGKAHIFIIRKA